MLITVLIASLAISGRQPRSLPVTQHMRSGTTFSVYKSPRSRLLLISLHGGARNRSEKPSKWIVVDLKDQRLTCFEGTEAVMQFSVSTGRKGIETPTGVVKVQAKKRYNYALPELGGGAIPYSLRIYMYDPKMKKTRRLNIHEADKVPDYPASSGCVRMKKGEGRKVFDWTPVGTPVHIVKDTG